MQSWELWIDGSVIGQVDDISGPEIALIGHESWDEEFIPVLRDGGTLTLRITPWRPFRETTRNGVERELVFRVPFRPAWWGRIKNWLLYRSPEARPVISVRGVIKDITGTVHEISTTVACSGPVSLIDSRSRLERAWDAMCDRLRDLGADTGPFS